MAQVLTRQDITLSEWWDSMYPYAMRLEKSITSAPQDPQTQDIGLIFRTLEDVLKGIQEQAYPDSASIMREYLLRATTYLIHAYQGVANCNTSEVDFYYSTALTNVARLHHQLVENGFAN